MTPRTLEPAGNAPAIAAPSAANAPRVSDP
jgi:hypothetical protein